MSFKEEYLKKIDAVIETGKYEDTWESLSQYTVPKWYQDAKFGIFIHWGIYSVPAFGSEWYSRNMYVQGSREYEHHIATYGNHKDFGYKDFIPMFKAENFNPDEWAELFKNAGAEYVVPVAEHHDGFQMYKSDVSHWNSYEMGPHRDVLGEISDSVNKLGIVNGASSHRVEHWFFMGHGKEFESDITDDEKEGDFYYPAMPEPYHHSLFSEPTPTKSFLEDWLVRCCEIVDSYNPKIVYFDWWIEHSAVKPYLKKFAAYYYNRAEERGEEVVINYKHDAFMFGTAVVDIEHGQFAEAKPYIWQTDTAVGRYSWGYIKDNCYKSPKEIICNLIDVVSKNGRMLLNIGPKPDGTIPDEDRSILLEIGRWLKTNGEGIYGSKVWRYSEEGPTETKEGQFSDGAETVYTSEDFRFTVKGDSLYVFAMNPPKSGTVTIKSLAEADASIKPVFSGIIKSVSLLGYDGEISYARDGEGMHIDIPNGTDTENPIVFKITMA
ncbi:MAG: alpha-L-fucosidase [Oscillospiraceae bacterium]|nr:alpha-L-fucosidase [Oscillospiraceae bacterium]